MKLKQSGSACVLIAGVMGCASTPQPLTRWENSLNDYTLAKNEGDPNAVRELSLRNSTKSLRPAQIAFSANDIPGGGFGPWSNKNDAHGVFVGNDESGRSIYMVGVVNRPQTGLSTLEDIRIAACRFDNGKQRCEFSNPDRTTLGEYVGSGVEGRTERHASHQMFPLLDDDFKLQPVDNEIVVTEMRSGATWRMQATPNVPATSVRVETSPTPRVHHVEATPVRPAYRPVVERMPVVDQHGEEPCPCNRRRR